MRPVRKSMLLALLVMAASALAAPAAFALPEPLAHDQTPRLLVAQEVHGAPDQACALVSPSPAPSPAPTVTSGGCRIHIAAADVEFWVNVGGMQGRVWTCDIEADMRMDASGEGYLSHPELSQCTATACGQTVPTDEGRAWSFYIREAEPAPTERITFVICLQDPNHGIGPVHCEYSVEFTEPAPHRYRFSSTGSPQTGSGPYCFPGIGASFFEAEAVLGVTGEGQAEQLLEVRHS
jgi:hypothetical protein